MGIEAYVNLNLCRTMHTKDTTFYMELCNFKCDVYSTARFKI